MDVAEAQVGYWRAKWQLQARPHTGETKVLRDLVRNAEVLLARR
jgi:hypothetical protein